MAVYVINRYTNFIRDECNCTEEMRQSLDISFSDCINKVLCTRYIYEHHTCIMHCYTQVYRHPYQQRFTFRFIISLGMGEEEMIVDPISVMEVNNRTSFEVQGEHRRVYACKTPFLEAQYKLF